jgi:hypothetical protein
MALYEYISLKARQNSSSTIGRRNTYHGLTRTRQYNIWQGMLQRCYNYNGKNYCYYGGKGIRVCNEWHDFKTFYNWSIQNGYADDLTLDRVDATKDYCPNNCRWADKHSQTNNRGNTILVEIDGEKLPLCEWANKYNLPYSKFYYKYKTGKIEQYIRFIALNAEISVKVEGEKE